MKITSGPTRLGCSFCEHFLNSWERERVLKNTIQYLKMEFTACWNSFGSRKLLLVEVVALDGFWDSCSVGAKTLVEGALIWFSISTISTWDERLQRSGCKLRPDLGLNCALKGKQIGWSRSWACCCDLWRRVVKVLKQFRSDPFPSFLSTKVTGSTSGALNGLLGSNTSEVLT